MDPNNQTGQNPSGEPTGNTDAQSQTDDSSQSGSAQAAAPEPPKYVHQLNGDLKSNEHVLKHQNINDLVSEYVTYAQKADRLVELPGDDADEQTRAAFFERVRPDSPERYKLNPLEGVDPAEDDPYRHLAHEIGLSQWQAMKIHDWARENISGQQNVMEQERLAAVKALKHEWGDDYEGRMTEVKRAFREVGGDDFARYMDQSGESTNPLMAKFFHQVWERIKPDQLVEGSLDASSATEGDWYPNTNFD